MKRWPHILIIPDIILAILFVIFSFELTVLGDIVFLAVYYAVNIFLLLQLSRYEREQKLLFAALAAGYVLDCFAESFLIGLPPLLIAAILISKQNKNRLIGIVNTVISLILLISFVVCFLVSRTIFTKEQSRISNGSISIVTLLADTGTTGSSYKYEADRQIGRIVVHRVLTSSKEKLDVTWTGGRFCQIGNQKFMVNIL